MTSSYREARLHSAIALAYQRFFQISRSRFCFILAKTDQVTYVVTLVDGSLHRR